MSKNSNDYDNGNTIPKKEIDIVNIVSKHIDGKAGEIYVSIFNNIDISCIDKKRLTLKDGRGILTYTGEVSEIIEDGDKLTFIMKDSSFRNALPVINYMEKVKLHIK